MAGRDILTPVADDDNGTAVRDDGAERDPVSQTAVAEPGRSTLARPTPGAADRPRRPSLQRAARLPDWARGRQVAIPAAVAAFLVIAVAGAGGLDWRRSAAFGPALGLAVAPPLVALSSRRSEIAVLGSAVGATLLGALAGIAAVVTSGDGQGSALVMVAGYLAAGMLILLSGGNPVAGRPIVKLRRRMTRPAASLLGLSAALLIAVAGWRMTSSTAAGVPLVLLALIPVRAALAGAPAAACFWSAATMGVALGLLITAAITGWPPDVVPGLLAAVTAELARRALDADLSKARSAAPLDRP
jgi:hypothetical protein